MQYPDFCPRLKYNFLEIPRFKCSATPGFLSRFSRFEALASDAVLHWRTKVVDRALAMGFDR